MRIWRRGEGANRGSLQPFDCRPNPKFEIRNPKEIRKPKSEFLPLLGGLWVHAAERIGSFGAPNSVSVFDNAISEQHEARSFVNQHAGTGRHNRGAGILPAGSGGILPPTLAFKTDSETASAFRGAQSTCAAATEILHLCSSLRAKTDGTRDQTADARPDSEATLAPPRIVSPSPNGRGKLNQSAGKTAEGLGAALSQPRSASLRRCSHRHRDWP